jgi:hypothetical protein
VLERSIEAVRAYWRQRIFTGRGVPPPELASEERAVEYVLGREGAVAYVSTDTELRGSKVLVVRD